MPYKSQKQESWEHTAEGTKALGGPGRVAEWDLASKGVKLPVRVPVTVKGRPSMGGKGNKRGR